ncbi:unnamed protein product [Gongylonema pulchrum]|uniref:DUF1943 domain-containing protein n=1 Tax=Gongylonema pulchrum TaxID=637853 RepID=A0A183DYN9_9BILA|nr:unnamed protein product [Gongylonema pulchrum]
MLVFELSRVFPTLSGLPLQFMLNASLAFKMDGKMRLNFVELLRQRGDADAQVKFRPSVSASLGARVLLRAGHVASGALASSNLYGATDFLRQMELRQGSRLSLKAEVPHHDIFIAKFRNDAAKVEMNRHQPLISIRRVRQAVDQRYCSGENLAKILGLKACYNVIFIFFTAGVEYKVKMTKPIRADFPVLEGTIRLEKADPALNSYQLLVERASDLHNLLDPWPFRWPSLHSPKLHSHIMIYHVNCLREVEAGLIVTRKLIEKDGLQFYKAQLGLFTHF